MSNFSNRIKNTLNCIVNLTVYSLHILIKILTYPNMKLYATCIAAFIILPATGYRIDLWANPSYQGTQRSYVSITELLVMTKWLNKIYRLRRRTEILTPLASINYGRGAHSLGFPAKSWIWTSSAGDGCCVVFCRGSTVGFTFRNLCLLL